MSQRSERSNPLNKSEIPRKNLPLKMGEKIWIRISQIQDGGEGSPFWESFSQNSFFLNDGFPKTGLILNNLPLSLPLYLSLPPHLQFTPMERVGCLLLPTVSLSTLFTPSQLDIDPRISEYFCGKDIEYIHIDRYPYHCCLCLPLFTSSQQNVDARIWEAHKYHSLP